MPRVREVESTLTYRGDALGQSSHNGSSGMLHEDDCIVHVAGDQADLAGEDEASVANLGAGNVNMFQGEVMTYVDENGEVQQVT